MLRELRITGSAVIEDAELDLGGGLTVLTGETGTGKTTVLTALTLLSGGRAAAGVVDAAAGALAVEGVWDEVPDGVADRTQEAGGVLDEGALVVRRTVGAQGRSRAVLGGATVPSSVLVEIGEELVALHGQSDQLLLRRPSLQREVLDRYAGSDHLDAVALHAQAFGRLQQVRQQRDDLIGRGDLRRREREEAEVGLEVIDALDPQPHEDVELKQEAQRLQNVDALHEAAAGALARLVGVDVAEPAASDAADSLAAARRHLAGGIAHDEALAALQLRLDELVILVDDVAAELRDYVGALDADAPRLEQVQQRRERLSQLARRYGGPSASLDEVLAWREDARARLAEPDDEAQVQMLHAEVEELEERLERSAAALSRTRRQSGAALAEAVTRELQDLAMQRAAFVVEVQPAAPGPTGADEVVLRLVARPGAAAVPLHKGASGGELSRVMLALEVVLAGADPVGTFVFDEVDAGVGGRAAVDVGRRLAELGRSRQVIVVTHLPQVAAFADEHVVVERDGTDARASLRVLSPAERIGELTRMLAGLEDSQAGRAHAEELLATAHTLKGRAPR